MDEVRAAEARELRRKGGTSIPDQEPLVPPHREHGERDHPLLDVAAIVANELPAQASEVASARSRDPL